MTILEKRIASLESRIVSSKPKVPHVVDDKTQWARISNLVLLGGDYSDWRHQVLSLEEVLALARKDATPKPEVWGDKWDPSVGRVTHQLLTPSVNIGAKVAARELEIRILERDKRIDEAEALGLRKNYHAHRHTEPTGSVALLELHFPIVLDEDALAEALRKCPRRESLTLEEQLELANGDNDDWYRRDTPVGSGLDELHDVMHKHRVAELQQAICERDATNESTSVSDISAQWLRCIVSPGA